MYSVLSHTHSPSLTLPGTTNVSLVSNSFWSLTTIACCSWKKEGTNKVSMCMCLAVPSL